MAPTLVIGNIVAFEISCKMGQEASSLSKQSIALTCNEHKKMKKKGKQVETSSSEDEMKNMMMIIKMKLPPLPLMMKKSCKS
jgi:hypothetical protein